jgi:hypothetical protein
VGSRGSDRTGASSVLRSCCLAPVADLRRGLLGPFGVLAAVRLPVVIWPPACSSAPRSPGTCPGPEAEPLAGLTTKTHAAGPVRRTAPPAIALGRTPDAGKRRDSSAILRRAVRTRRPDHWERTVGIRTDASRAGTGAGRRSALRRKPAQRRRVNDLAAIIGLARAGRGPDAIGADLAAAGCARSTARTRSSSTTSGGLSRSIGSGQAA